MNLRRAVWFLHSLLLTTLALNPLARAANGEESYGQKTFASLVAKKGLLINYAAQGTYLSSDRLSIDVLMSVTSRAGTCYFGVVKGARPSGVVQAATGFQCILVQDGDSVGSAGTGNLHPQFMAGSLNAVDSIDQFPAEISIEYSDAPLEYPK